MDGAETPETCTPEHLAIFVGGFMGPSYGVRWEEGHLLYGPFDRGYQKQEPHELDTSRASWQRFWNTLNKLGVWDWQESYENPEVADGTHWSVEITYAKKHVSASGSNAYPEAPNSTESGKTFRAFCRAVRLLVGGRPFS